MNTSSADRLLEDFIAGLGLKEPHDVYTAITLDRFRMLVQMEGKPLEELDLGELWTEARSEPPFRCIYVPTEPSE